MKWIVTLMGELEVTATRKQKPLSKVWFAAHTSGIVNEQCASQGKTFFRVKGEF